MGASNEVLNVVLEELRHYGLKPTIEQLAKATHVSVRWTAPGKTTQRAITVGRSSSTDVRTRMNARAEVRRLIRADGLQSPVIERSKKSIGQRIMEPAPNSEPAHIQLAQMRQEIGDITDLLLDIVLAVGAKERPSKQAAAEAMNGHAVPADIEKLPKFKRTAADQLMPGSVQERVFRAFPENGAPMRVADIANGAGIPLSTLGGTMAALTKRGLVANPARGWWRRADKPLPEGWKVPSKIKPTTVPLIGVIGEKEQRRPGDLTQAQADVLAALPVGRPFQPGEVCKALKITSALLDFHLRRLADKGRAKRVQRGWWARVDAFGRVPEAAPPQPPSLSERLLAILPEDRAFRTGELTHVRGARHGSGGALTQALRVLERQGLAAQLQRGWWAKVVEGQPLPEVPARKEKETYEPQPATAPPEGFVMMEGSATDLVWRALPKAGVPVSFADLKARIDRPQGSLASALNWLKNKGVVISPSRGVWERA